jgi:hypothetical protein
MWPPTCLLPATSAAKSTPVPPGGTVRATLRTGHQRPYQESSVRWRRQRIWYVLRLQSFADDRDWRGGGEKPIKITRGPTVRNEARGPDYVAYVFFSVVSLFVDCTDYSFSTSHPATDSQFSNLVLRFLARSATWGHPPQKKKFFSPWPWVHDLYTLLTLDRQAQREYTLKYTYIKQSNTTLHSFLGFHIYGLILDWYL